MLPTDQEVNEAKSKPASEVPWLDEGPYYTIKTDSAYSKALNALARAKQAAPCRQRD